MMGASQFEATGRSAHLGRFCAVVMSLFCIIDQSVAWQNESPQPQTISQQLPDPHAYNPLAGSAPTSPWFGYSSPVRASIYAGQSYSEPDSFLSLEMLRPLRTWRFSGGSEQIQYLDARAGVNFNGNILTNLGFGRRHYFAADNAILDANIWYDFDNTGSHAFHQITAGSQWRTNRYSIRAHYHFPIFEVDRVARYVDLPNIPTFSGNNISMPRLRIEEQAYQGIDTELGILHPYRSPVEFFVGGYHFFSSTDAEHVSGVTSTLRWGFDNGVNLSVQGSYDDQTEGAVMFAATYDFTNRKRNHASVRDHLGESVRRNRHILRRDLVFDDPTPATDADGNLFNVIHVSSTGNSNGTFESPYATLAEAAVDAAATPNSIIFVHADSVLDGQSIVLPENTRLLGEGIDHLFTSPIVGSAFVPRATTGTARPIIRNTAAGTPAITLANGVEISGFRIENAGDTAIFGTGLTEQVDITNNRIDGAVTGIHIADFGNTLNLKNNTILNTTGTGIHLERFQATSVVNLQETTSITTAGLHGLHFDRAVGGSSIVLATDATLTVDGTTNHGIFFDDNEQNAAATFDGTTSISNTGGDGLLVSNLTSLAGGTANRIDFVGNVTISNTGGTAFNSQANASEVSFQSLNLTNWSTSAINIANTTAPITFGQSLNLVNAGGSLNSTINIANSTQQITFADVTIDDTARTANGAATVNLFDNDTGVNEVTFTALNVTSNNGVSLQAQATGGNLTQLEIAGGTISTTGGSSAIVLDNIGTDITLQSVSVSDTTIGISLQDLGAASAFHQKFQIVGDSTTAGSGGTISNVQTGVFINGSEDVALHLMNIDATVVGVRAQSNGFNDPQAMTLNGLNLTDGSGSANWIGVHVRWDGGAHLDQQNLIANNTFTGTGANQTGLRIVNVQSNPPVDFTIGGNTMNLSGTSSVGIDLNVTGFAGTTANLGGLNLSATTNNFINITNATHLITEQDDATVQGQILINGLLIP